MLREEDLLKQMRTLIIGASKKFIEQVQDKNEISYRTRHYPLTNKMVLEHLNGVKTLGVFYCNNGSKFLCFDIDDRDTQKTLAVKDALIEIGVPLEHIHIEDSGSKGWHIWLFFENPFAINSLVAFGKHIINGLVNIDNKKIELRPESMNSKGIKMPLGIQKKTGKRTEFVQHDLQPIQNQADYFLDIKPMPHSQMQTILDKAIVKFIAKAKPRKQDNDKVLCSSVKKEEKQFAPLREGISTLSNKVEYLINYSMEAYMTDDKKRHYNQFFVALFYKQQGLSKEEVTKLVLEWALKQRELGLSNSSEAEIYSDVSRDVEAIMRSDDKILFDGKAKRLFLCKEDLIFTNIFKSEIDRKVFWATLLLGRLYSREGQFHFSQRQIMQMTQLPKSSVHRSIHKLLREDYLTLVEKGGYHTKNASTYKMPYLLENMQPLELELSKETYREIFIETFLLTKDINLMR